MASDGESSESRKDALMQSYIQGVERVAQQDNQDPGIGFSLPREVIQRRENVWSNFFDKYASETPNDVVLNVSTMEPVGNKMNTNEEEEEEEEDDEDNDEDNKEYYSKCRAPIRKLPALIQYWVDTGNPPYQLTGDENHSDTGSSLSEGEYSRSNQSAALRKSIEDPKFDENSPYSSVDTAAYVLSNANVTEKAKTQEIVEGAKKSNEDLRPKVAAQIQENHNSSTVADKATKQSDNGAGNEILKTPPKSAPLNCMTTPGGSVMLSEVLPALQQFDDLLEKSKHQKKPRSALSKVRRIRKTSSVAKSKIKENEKSLVESQPNDKSTKSTNDSKTMANFRKLYTGRNSPCDLIMPENTSKLLTTGPVSHPALEPAATTETRTFPGRARARRKRKRSSLRKSSTMSDILRYGLRTSSQESRELVQDDKNNNNSTEKEGHERYTEFFESLGLTPKKTSTDSQDDKVVKQRNTRRNFRRLMKNKTARTNWQNESQESLETSLEITPGSSQKREPSPEIVPNSTNKLMDIVGKKILSIRLTKLSDQVLARYERKKSESFFRWDNELPHYDNSNIEVLTTATNDSDSSTILIYSCSRDNNDQSYDSDSFSLQKMLSSPTSDADPDNVEEREKSRSPVERNVTTKTEESSSKNIKLRTPVVRVSKLPQNREANVARTEAKSKDKPRDLNTAKPTIESSFQPKSADSEAKNLNEYSSHPSILMENGTRCLELAPRRRGKSRKFENLETDESDRFSFGFSFKTTSEPDEDCFVKLIREESLSPRKNRKKIEKSLTVERRETGNEEMNSEPETDVKNGHKSYSRIVVSSDEEEEDVKFSRKFRSIRSPRKIDTKLSAPKRSKNIRKVIDEVTDRLNGEKVPVGSAENHDKSEDDKPTDASTKNRENSDLRRSGRKRSPATWLNGAIETKNSSGESSDFVKTVDFRKNNEFGDLTVVNSNFRPAKRKLLEHETSLNPEKSKVSRVLKFCTRLSSDSDSHFGSESQESVIANEKSVRAKPISPKLEPVKDPKKALKKRKNVKESEKKSLHLLDEKPGQKPRRSLASHDSTSTDSRKKKRISPARSKNSVKTRGRETATKKLRRTRILGTPIQDESDDDDDVSEHVPIVSQKSIKLDYAINEKASIRSKAAKNVDIAGPEKRQDYLQNFFPDISEDSIQDIDNIFKSNGHTRDKKSPKNLTILVKPIVNKHLLKTRKSTTTFRTKLTSDSENDADL